MTDEKSNGPKSAHLKKDAQKQRIEELEKRNIRLAIELAGNSVKFLEAKEEAERAKRNSVELLKLLAEIVG